MNVALDQTTNEEKRNAMTTTTPYVVTYRLHGERHSFNIWAADRDAAKKQFEEKVPEATDVKVYE